jgi:parallel beta-helix repeat protein
VGFEYAAKYMLGETVPAYGQLSLRGRGKFNDIYAGIYQHYHFVKGLEMPFTKRVLEQMSAKRLWSVLTLSQADFAEPTNPQSLSPLGGMANQAGATDVTAAALPAGAVTVVPGKSLQSVFNKLTAGGCVVLTKGTYILPAPLRIPSNVTIIGHGSSTILMLDSNIVTQIAGATIVNGRDDLHDVTLKDFVIEGSADVRASNTDPNQDRRQRAYPTAPGRAGILFRAQHAGQMHDLNFEHVTVRGCTQNGVAIFGAEKIIIVACDFSDNGAGVSPGPGLLHNLLLAHTGDVIVRDSRFDDSLRGSGMDISGSHDVEILNNETARNARNGIHLAESQNVHLRGNRTEGNDQNGMLLDGLMDGCQRIEAMDNLLQNNGGRGIMADRVELSNLHDNLEHDNGGQ